MPPRMLRERHSVEGLRGKRPSPDHLELRLEDGDRVYKPDGEPLAILLQRVISERAAELAYPFLHELRRHTSRNRGDYSGEPRQLAVRRSGKVSQTNEAVETNSVVIGFFDRNPRFPFCRTTALVTKNPSGWGALQPMIQEVASAFRETLPRRYFAQERAALNTHPAYVIPRTPYTTLTVNNTVPAAYHYDKGDYTPGFGCIAVLRRGVYTGGELVFPAFRCGADLHDRDLLLFDPHELHGNLPIVGEGARMLPEEMGHERVSIVFYFREKMLECLSPAEELERVKMARGGLGDQ